MVNETQSALKIDIVGTFFDEQNLRTAIEELQSAGMEFKQMGLLCAESVLRDKLGHLYRRIDNNGGDAESPDMDFVDTEAVGNTPYAALGAMAFIGGAVGGGALVATAGILGGALAVATAGTAVVGSLGVLASELMSKSDAEALQEQLDVGHILLFVRIDNSKLKDEIIKIIHERSGTAPRELAPEVVVG